MPLRIVVYAHQTRAYYYALTVVLKIELFLDESLFVKIEKKILQPFDAGAGEQKIIK